MQMAAKVVYYGPGLSGKTTTLHYIYCHTAKEIRGEMVSLETETDRTLFFDLLPIDIGTISGYNTRIQLYAVPGRVSYNTTRKLVLKGVDGIVFVADSQRPMAQANFESLRNLEENLAEMGLSLDTLPLVLQLNKRDLPNLCSVEEMNRSLNRRNWTWVESSAITGTGIFETFREVSRVTILALQKRMARGPEGPAAVPHLVASPRPTNQTTQSILDACSATSSPRSTQPRAQATRQAAQPEASRPLQVFLCHSSADKPKVRDLHKRLHNDGFSPWLDEEDILGGQIWDVEIRKAVRAADVVAVCLSRSSVTKAGYIQKEIRFALDVAEEKPEGTIYIVPVKLEECSVPGSLLKWQWVSLFDEAGYERLLRSLRVRAGALGL